MHQLELVFNLFMRQCRQDTLSLIKKTIIIVTNSITNQNGINQCYTVSTLDTSGATKYYRSHSTVMLSTLDAALCGMTNLWQKTAAALYLWHADTNFQWFVGRLYLLRRGMSGVDSPIEKKQSNLCVDRRPSTPSVLSSAGKLIRYLHGSYFLP